MMRVVLLWLLLAGPVWAVEPDEMLGDPGLEARARAISQGLRCPVCQNENIDDSHAAIARDLRILLRERLVAGDSDDEAVAFVVARYGEYVILNPAAQGINLILWLAGPGLLLVGAAIAFGYLRGRNAVMVAPTPLTDEEQRRVQDILGNG